MSDKTQFRKDRNNDAIDDGWKLTRRGEDEGGEWEETVGYLDTEYLVDLLLQHLTDHKPPFQEGVWY